MSFALRLAALAIVIALPLAGAAAQESDAAKRFPARPIRIVVPFPAGGPTDIDMRIIAQKMSEDWGVGVVVDNRAGGNTTIGAQAVAKAAPDGYTLLAAMDTTLVLNPATGITADYDPFRDFVTITLTAKNTSLLSVRARDGPKTVKELIAIAKANPGKLNYGAGILTTRLSGYLFAKEAGIDVVLIPYKGSAEVVQGLLTGAVDFIVDGVASHLSLIKSGQFRALAKLNNRPLSQLPNLPTLAQAADLPQLEDMGSWIGLVAPAGTPSPIIDKIQQEVVRATADPATAEKLDKAGINAVTSTPAEFDAFFRSEAVRWSKMVKESGIKLE
ncbi:MAG: tripartite tricarboxylate transporter substrate binding protein [Xanthobacteraceae bacterium]